MSAMCRIYNYADDNTIAVDGHSYPEVLQQLELSASHMIKWFDITSLKANTEKFQFIIFDKSDHSHHSIELHGKSIENKDTVKLLGVHIDKHLTFDSHITELCLKAGRKLNVLSRLSNILDVNAKMRLNNAFIMSQFQYCVCIWHFCNKTNTRTIEKIQCRALRHIYNDYTSSYQHLRETHTVPLLYVKRIRKIMVEMYKIVNGISPIYLKNMISHRENIYNLRSSDVQLPQWSTSKYGHNTFKYQATKLWRSLTGQDKEPASLKSFKMYINQWNGPMCSCSHCILCVLNQL